MKNLIIAKNKVEFAQLKDVKTPKATDTHTPISHFLLATLAKEAMTKAGLTVEHEEHAIARDGLRYFGGFAVSGADVQASDRKLVVGLRNSGDKSFAASICLGTSMMVCENLCFSSDIKLARRHTVNIMADLPRVLASAIAGATNHWADMTTRIEAYKQAECEDVERLAVQMADCKALPPRDIYNVVKSFRNPEHVEFNGGSLWTVYNAVTEHLKGGDLTKLPQRTAMVQSILDPLANLKKAEGRVVLAS
ncbi:DUF945 domain-containing protein [bacterium]|nr:DUF945 domain-containing protein [bacterium]